jgi:hypothetical protein
VAVVFDAMMLSTLHLPALTSVEFVDAALR